MSDMLPLSINVYPVQRQPIQTTLPEDLAARGLGVQDTPRAKPQDVHAERIRRSARHSHSAKIDEVSVAADERGSSARVCGFSCSDAVDERLWPNASAIGHRSEAYVSWLTKLAVRGSAHLAGRYIREWRTWNLFGQTQQSSRIARLSLHPNWYTEWHANP